LEGEAELQVEVAIGDGGESETGLGGIVQMGTDCGEIDERHLDFATVAIRPYRWPFGKEGWWVRSIVYGRGKKLSQRKWDIQLSQIAIVRGSKDNREVGDAAGDAIILENFGETVFRELVVSRYPILSRSQWMCVIPGYWYHLVTSQL
jgi:hypothetical protein